MKKGKKVNEKKNKNRKKKMNSIEIYAKWWNSATANICWVIHMLMVYHQTFIKEMAASSTQPYHEMASASILYQLKSEEWHNKNCIPMYHGNYVSQEKSKDECLRMKLLLSKILSENAF